MSVGKRIPAGIAAVAALAVLVILFLFVDFDARSARDRRARRDASEETPAVQADASETNGAASASSPSADGAKDGTADPDDDSTDEDDETDAQAAERKREAEEERLADAFDALTDAWTEPAAKGVSMADVEKFVSAFRRLPKSRRDECLHRALNLVPDENVMLLAGVLMDKATDAETAEEVYNDILNRDEEVKQPILQQIFKDKNHPCWADTAWILDVTDALPKAKE